MPSSVRHGPNRTDPHVTASLGPERLAYLLSMLDPGPDLEPEVRSVPEWVELVRRLHVPGYEEARQQREEAEVTCQCRGAVG